MNLRFTITKYDLPLKKTNQRCMLSIFAIERLAKLIII